MPFAIFLLHNYMSSLPGELIESARVDGADHFSTFVRLVLPLSVPAIAAFATFQFLWTWNDYLIAVVMLNGGTLRCSRPPSESPTSQATSARRTSADRRCLCAGVCAARSVLQPPALLRAGPSGCSVKG